VYNDEVLGLFKIAAPERTQDFDSIWARFRPQFEKVADRPGFVLETTSWFIRSTDRTTLTIWLLGYALWQEMYCWASFIFELARHRKEFVLADFESLEGQQEEYAKADALYLAALHFMNSDTLDMKLWPVGVPRPGEIFQASKEEQLVNDLVHHTVAFFYLHELRHFILANESGQPLEPIQEELECDRWASEHLLGRTDDYRPQPAQPGQDATVVKSKRAMGVALGAAVMAHIQELGLWETTNNHPSVAQRFIELSKTLSLGTEDHYWNVACTFALASLRRKKGLPTRVSFSDLRNLLSKLLEAR